MTAERDLCEYEMLKSTQVKGSPQTTSANVTHWEIPVIKIVSFSNSLLTVIFNDSLLKKKMDKHLNKMPGGWK